MTLDKFQALIATVTEDISSQSIDQDLQDFLNDKYPVDGTHFQAITSACKTAINDGWMCDREYGGIRFGRVIKPTPELHGFSVDVVDMDNVVGPHHSHPNGEIDMIMPLDENAEFDGHGEGWLVYAPGSSHKPTVSKGRAYVLYLLPEGAIEFTR